MSTIGPLPSKRPQPRKFGAMPAITQQVGLEACLLRETDPGMRPSRGPASAKAAGEPGAGLGQGCRGVSPKILQISGWEFSEPQLRDFSEVAANQNFSAIFSAEISIVKPGQVARATAR